MKNLEIPAIVIAVLILSCPAVFAAPLHKCVINGSVTYQDAPCPAAAKGRPPTVEDLNAERKKKLDQAKDRSSTADRKVADNQPRAAPSATFRCDSRKHCSQMTSCAEATYFLAHCPGVQMDGDGDGVACEQQWCGR